MRMGKSILGLTTIMFLVAGIDGFQTAFAANNGFLSRRVQNRRHLVAAVSIFFT